MAHIPVLLKETVEFLQPKKGSRIIDATAGEAGHIRALTKAGAEVLGLDRDPEVVQKLSEAGIAGLTAVHGRFGDLKSLAQASGFEDCDGVLFDIGMGSHQLDDPKRGFSFQTSGALDMRYDQTEARSKTAELVVNKYAEKDLIRIFREFGEENRFAKRVAKIVLEERKKGTIATTEQLYEIVRRAVPAKLRFMATDVARRIFQSLRIEVNGELEELRSALPQAVTVLRTGGRVAVISFHSLEDRIIKNFFKEQSAPCICPPDLPICKCGRKPTLKIITRKPITASEEEKRDNTRSRSAKLRVAEKL